MQSANAQENFLTKKQQKPQNMKKSNQSFAKINAFAVVAMALSSQVKADSARWIGSSNSTWATSTNWTSDPNPVPGTGNTATFDDVGGTIDTIDLGAGVSIGSIVFDTANVAAYTIGSGAVGTQTLTLDPGGSIIANNSINNNQVFNANLVLGADATAQSYSLTNSDSNNSVTFAGTITGGSGGTAGPKSININSASTGGIVLSGLISNGGASSLTIVKSGAGVLNISTAAHTFSGGVTVEAGTLTISGTGSLNNSTVFLGASGNTGANVRIGVVNSTTNPSSPLTVVAQTSGAATTRILGTNSSTSGQWSGAITMNGDLTVSTATAGGFTLNSGATVNLNSNTLTLANSSTTSAINVVAKGKISGSGNVVVNNTSTGNPTVGLVIIEGTDHDYTGSTTISAGTLQIGNNGAVGSIASTSSIINSGTLDYKRTGTLNQGGPISGTGAVRIVGSGTVTFDKANTYSGTTTIGNSGKITVATGGSIAPTTGNSLTLGNGGSGTLQYDSASTSKFGGIVVGNGTTNTGTLNQTAGTINGSSMTLNSAFSGTGIGTVNLSGGNLNLTGNISGSSQVSGDAIYSAINISGTAALSANTFFLTGAPSATRNAACRVTQSGGTVTLTGPLTLARTTASNTAPRRGDYYLNGGTLTTSAVDQNAGADTVGTFYFGGGTLKPAASSTTFFQGITAAYVYGNAVIDTGANDITIAQPLLYTANTGVVSIAVTTGGTGYAASSRLPMTFTPPASGRTASGIAVTNSSGVVTSIVITDPGTGYTSEPTFTISGGGTGGTYVTTMGQPAGITTSGGGLSKSGSGKLTLTGASTYTGATTVSAGTLALEGASLASSITVNSGALLGFALGSPATTTGAVSFVSGSKVKITGTPTLSSYTLLTASSFNGTPVMNVAISGYELVVVGTELKLNASAGGYSAWQTANGTTQTMNLDHDNDGVANGVEYFLGGNTSTSGYTALPSILGNTVTWVSHSSYNGAFGTDFKVQSSSDLSTWTDATTSGTPGVPGTVYLSGHQVIYSLPEGSSKIFVRLVVNSN